MDVLSPQLLWIGKRCYRVNSTADEGNTKKYNAATFYVEDDLYAEDDDDTDTFEIELTDNDRFRSTFHIPQYFFAQIIGSKGSTKKRIESETKTQIKIPKQGVEGGIVVIGPTRQSVISSRRKINLIVLAARNKLQFTHFLSVPFNSQTIVDNFIKFKDDILSTLNVPGIDESLFQNPRKLHLTIATLSLMDNEDRIFAAQILQECQKQIIEPSIKKFGVTELSLVGLEYMNDDPSSVDVLYGKVESEFLQHVSNKIADRFIEKGLMQRKTDTVKLHVTLINSLFRDGSGEADSQKGQRITFDARKILENYRDYYFGSINLTEIHLSQRYSTSCDGYYEATGIIKLS